MKVVSKILPLFLLIALSACVGGGALEGGDSSGSSLGEVGGGQGQPTIQPGADHQPGTPIEDDDKLASDDLAIPPPPPTDEPNPGHGGPTDLTN